MVLTHIPQETCQAGLQGWHFCTNAGSTGILYMVPTHLRKRPIQNASADDGFAKQL
jgi:hypothetical protein